MGFDGIFRGSEPYMYSNSGDYYSENGYDERKEYYVNQMWTKFTPQTGRPCDQCFPYFKLQFEDHGVNIAQSAAYLIARPDIKPYIDLPRMSEEAQKMLADAMNAFSTHNTRLAIDVVERDDVVDHLGEQILRELLTYMMADPTTIDRALQILFISGNLERVADLATNIAEDVVFANTGRLIRHNRLSKEELDKLA